MAALLLAVSLMIAGSASPVEAAVCSGAGPTILCTGTVSASSGTRVDACADANGTPVDLAACLNSAAYSIFFKFATDRVILK